MYTLTHAYTYRLTTLTSPLRVSPGSVLQETITAWTLVTVDLQKHEPKQNCVTYPVYC